MDDMFAKRGGKFRGRLFSPWVVIKNHFSHAQLIHVLFLITLLLPSAILIAPSFLNHHVRLRDLAHSLTPPIPQRHPHAPFPAHPLRRRPHATPHTPHTRRQSPTALSPSRVLNPIHCIPSPTPSASILYTFTRILRFQHVREHYALHPGWHAPIKRVAYRRWQQQVPTQL